MNRSILSVIYGVITIGVVSGLTGCASNQSRQAHLDVFQEKKVSKKVYRKIENYEKLSLTDIKYLSKKSIPDDVLVRQLKNTRAVYKLSSKQVQQLRKSGVSEPVVDYMLASARKNRNRYYRSYYGYRGYHHSYHPFHSRYRFHHHHHHRYYRKCY